MIFEWDETKDAFNQAKHGVSFEEAIEVFRADVEAIEIYDAAHSEVEERFITIGPISRGLVLVVWTERDEDIVRIISARWAKKAEVRLFRESIGGQHE